MRRSPAAVVSTMYLTVAAAGVALATVGGTSRTSLLIGLVMAFGGGFLGIGGTPGAAPARRGTVRENWWKFIVASPMLVGAVILAAELGVQAWFLGIATVLVAIALFITGVVLGVAHLFDRRTGLPAA